jgi:hypothetical protein
MRRGMKCNLPREDNKGYLGRYPMGDNECNITIIME